MMINLSSELTLKFIMEARSIHGDKYDYSKTEYFKSKIKVIINCPIHGDFKQTPNSHLNNRGCKKCASDARRLTKEEFISRAHDTHFGLYDYKKVKYVNYKTPVIITCKIHGDFEQTPRKHLLGCRCPMQKRSKGKITCKRR